MADDNNDFTNGNSEHEKLFVQTSAAERPRRTTPMNTSATDWVHSLPVLRSTGRMLLVVIARHSDLYGCSWCSQKTLAAETGCCDRTVRNLLKGFENRNLIRRIGRMGDNGAQTTDVIMLVGWPERKLLPDTGHPKSRVAVKETPETKRSWAYNRAQPRNEIPEGAETNSDQNKEILNKPITVGLEKALEACFAALGPWATSENRQYLVDDLSTLQSWLEKGIDLNRHILPVLAEKAKNTSKIPILRTWRYFENPIGKAASRKHPSNYGVKFKKTAHAEAPDDPDWLGGPNDDGGSGV